MSTDTSIGPDGAGAGNENRGNADGCGNKTLGDKAQQQPPAGTHEALDTQSQRPDERSEGEPTRK